MGVYLSILSGAIKLFNSIAQALQQRHDEMNGRNAQSLADTQASVKGDINAEKTTEAVSGLSDDALNAELRSGPAANR